MINIQAIIMAAGKGSRIEELTEGHPKSFLKMAGQTLIERNIAMLHAHNVTDITIVTGYKDQEFEALVGGQDGIKLIFNPFYELTNVIGSFFIGMNNLREDFLYLHADTICEDAVITELIKAKGDVILPVDKKPCDDEAMKVKLENGKVAQVTKEMPTEKALGEFIGIAKITEKVVDDLKGKTTELMRKKQFQSYFEAALQKLIEIGRYDFQVLDVSEKFWAEIDFAEDYECAVAMLVNYK